MQETSSVVIQSYQATDQHIGDVGIIIGYSSSINCCSWLIGQVEGKIKNFKLD